MAGQALSIGGGGTSQTTAPGARKALGLEIGVNIQAWDADLDALAALASTGIAVRTATDTWVTRTLAAPAAGFTITNPAGIAGNPTFVLADDLAGLEGLATTGISVRSAASTWVTRSILPPSAGITITNGDGIAGNIQFNLANDLSAVEALGTTGIAVRTAASTWTTRTLTGTANQITITQGDGVAGNPTVALANPLITPGDATVNGILVVNTNLNPDANDGAGLGTGVLGWSDLFLAAGGVINWNNGAVTETEASGTLTWSSTAAVPTFNFVGNDPGGFGPFVQLYHNSASPAVSDVIGEYTWQGNSSTGVKRTYSAFLSIIGDPTNTTEAATMQFYNQQSGTLTQQMSLNGTTGLNLLVGGIKFPASQVAFADANTLDDYEEGTWTPSYITTGVAMTSVTYDPATAGYYTKIGRQVIAYGRIRTDAITKGGGTGNIRVSGLPFTSANVTGVAGFVGQSNTWTTNAPTYITVAPATTSFNLWYYAVATGVSAIQVANLGTGADSNEIEFCVIYHI